ncbi:hypothetical protein GCM10008995_02220 [Halobellus salinus]|uniref:Winged helix-turn helix domain-containing protein n=1 Tax=Halobellus salinus TaxID=931585 RepID=A0A830EBK5_9EURY|nr:hypothetical protein GCM10008995_02220 [Halobellus salinus]
MSSFGGSRPPKLDEDEQEGLFKLLKEGQPWKSQEIQHLLAEEFGVGYHPDYLGEFLRGLGLSYTKLRPKRPNRPENPEEILDERVADALDETDDQPHHKEHPYSVKDRNQVTALRLCYRCRPRRERCETQTLPSPHTTLIDFSLSSSAYRRHRA